MPTFYVASEQAAERVCTFVRAQAARKPITVTVAEPKRLRSIAANGRYWVLLTLIADHIRPEGKGFSKEAWHEYFKRKHLEPEERGLPNGKVVLEYPSTSDMAHEAFVDYMTAVEAWANERGVILE